MKKLTNFLPPQESKNAVNKSKVDRFIKMFNLKIQKGLFVMNDVADGFVELTDPEFELARQQADKNQYVLTRFDDNYNSTSYKLTPKE
jgi:hypothetical protein